MRYFFTRGEDFNTNKLNYDCEDDYLFIKENYNALGQFGIRWQLQLFNNPFFEFAQDEHHVTLNQLHITFGLTNRAASMGT
jgi:hypothetical protein